MRGLSLPGRQLVSNADSAKIEAAHVQRSRFLNTWTRKTTFDPGWLIPILVDEILPGDHMNYDVTAYIRMQTPLFPQFDNIRIDTFFFFVPCRLLWSSWKGFMGEELNPGTYNPALTIPIINDLPNGGAAVNSIFDHMGIPVAGQIAAGETIEVNALPFRAYNRIWQEWFRDENIQTAPTNGIGDGPDSQALYFNRRRAKAPDYFTTALPWPQKFTAPTISLGTTAPILGIGVHGAQPQHGAALTAINETSRLNVTYAAQAWGTDATPNQIAVELDAATGIPKIYADLGAATGVAINTLRQAFLVQQLLERDARGGTRYTEIIRAHFGAISPDFRLQRAEYIGGGQSPLNITPIAQTATGGSGLGALGGAGVAAGTHRASVAATEHGYVIGLITARVEESYQQGLHRMWTRATRFDFFWPALAQLGEQAVLMQEIYCTGNAANDSTIFGYQERYQEYRTRNSEVVGIMRSTAAGTLDAWHLSRKYTAAPALNNAFIEDNTTAQIQRILAAGAATAGMAFLADIQYRRTATRPVPTFGTPVTLGRF